MNTQKNIQEYIEREKKIQPNPWLSTRIMARIEAPGRESVHRWQPLLLAASILLMVALGVGIGKTYLPNTETYAGISIDDSDIERFEYFNLEGDE